MHSSLSVPVLDGAQVVGALNTYATVAHAFDTPFQLAAEALAGQGAYTIRYLQPLHRERAARATERGVAETLQRSLLPTVPTLEGVSCAARYLPSTTGARVGGDWYDVFALPDGAIGVAIGDVMGHEVAAVYARLVLGHAGAMMLFANAGHLPPLLQQPDGTVRRLTGAASRLIGVRLTGLRAARPPHHRNMSAGPRAAGGDHWRVRAGLSQRSPGRHHQGRDQTPPAEHRPKDRGEARSVPSVRSPPARWQVPRRVNRAGNSGIVAIGPVPWAVSPPSESASSAPGDHSPGR